jgi:hypothetical protein
VGILSEKVKLALLVNGNGVPDNFKNNSLYFYEMYSKSTPDILNVKVQDIFPGGFYFFHYQDSSNWMKWAPVFVADYKKFSNKIIIFALNFNMIPLEVRVLIFDKYITETDFEKNNFLKVDYVGLYNELRSLGFEYTLMEFDAIRLEIVHRISLDLLPRFLYHQHPQNVYDPKKLNEIWCAKIGTRDQRHKEMMISSIEDFYNIDTEISEKYDVLRDRIMRIRNNAIKYGKLK